MNKSKILGFMISLLIGVLMIFIGVEGRTEAAPNLVYRVYLNGDLLGLIDSEAELLSLIDERQYGIRERYGVDKVHPPSGLEIRAARTFNQSITTAEEIYDMIEDTDPFTIEGYTITIVYAEEGERPHYGTITDREPLTMHVLNQEDFEEAFKTIIGAFVGSDQFELFIEDNQPEIVDTGSVIETIYWQERISIRPSLISTQEPILKNAGEISRYLFFGTTEDQESYTVRAGDDIESISAAHNLNPDEFLVANPEFRSRYVLLTPGQVVNVGLIEPVVSIVAEKHVVEDVRTRYETEYRNDPNSWVGTTRVAQEGVRGTSRVTEKIRYVNGEVHNLVIANHQVLTPTVNRVVYRGTRQFGGGGDGTGPGTGGQSNESWSWPTNSPSVITSRFGPRWGRWHSGIDITGTGHGSPIRAVASGIVITNASDSGWGNYVIIDHQNGYFTLYAHFARRSPIPVGTRVARGQVIGAMGCTGWCTGTHLHFEVKRGSSWSNSVHLDPCRSIFRC